MDKCRTIDPEMIAVSPKHRIACHLVTEQQEMSHAAAAV
jgi:hypothetical protein